MAVFLLQWAVEFFIGPRAIAASFSILVLRCYDKISGAWIRFP